jgi:hypothetical protein
VERSIQAFSVKLVSSAWKEAYAKVDEVLVERLVLSVEVVQTTVAVISPDAVAWLTLSETAGLALGLALALGLSLVAPVGFGVPGIPAGVGEALAAGELAGVAGLVAVPVPGCPDGLIALAAGLRDGVPLRVVPASAGDPLWDAASVSVGASAVCLPAPDVNGSARTTVAITAVTAITVAVSATAAARDGIWRLAFVVGWLPGSSSGRIVTS